MTAIATILDGAQGEILDALGTAATVQRSPAAPVAVQVGVIDKQAENGPHGQRVGNERRVRFLKSAWDPQRGDLVTIDGLAQRVAQITADDGIEVEVVIRG